MTKRVGKCFILFLAIFSLLLTVSCAKKQVTPEPPAMPEALMEEAIPEEILVPSEPMEEEDMLAEERLYQERQAQIEAELRDKFGNEDIYFEFDKSRLLPEAKEILKEKAEWLSMHEDVTVTIEGHCDERGTNEYNLALGDRRAESAKRFLTDLGISVSRLTTVSYGEERPVDLRHNEEAWAKNRRAHFVID
jgi:peptidoglycan-associated lipoprotein